MAGRKNNNLVMPEIRHRIFLEIKRPSVMCSCPPYLRCKWMHSHSFPDRRQYGRQNALSNQTAPRCSGPLGMGVPAVHWKSASLMAILSNINVVNNLMWRAKAIFNRSKTDP
jgi:hypothetical protein